MVEFDLREGWGGMKNKFYMILVVLCHQAYADPYQLDVAGIVPGVSTPSQVAGKKHDGTFDVGGYSLICADDYIDGFLSDFTCFFGEEYSTRDLVTEKKTGQVEIVSNLVVYEKLLYGLTKKFEAKPEIFRENIENYLGREMVRYTAVWTDKKGNKIYLKSMERTENESTLILRSVAYLEREQKASNAEEQARQF